MEFWNWYLSEIKKTFGSKRLKSGYLEYAVAIVIFVAGSLILSIEYTPLWLIATIPIGFTLGVHGLWRVEQAKDKQFGTSVQE